MKCTYRISDKAKDKIVALSRKNHTTETAVLEKMIMTYSDDLSESQLDILSVKKSLRNCEFTLNILQSAFNNLLLQQCENAVSFTPLKQNTHLFLQKAKAEEESRLRLMSHKKKYGGDDK